MALQPEAGFGHTVQLLEQSHLCTASGDRGQGGQAGICAELCGGATSQGAGGMWAAPGAPDSAGTALGKDGTSPGEVAPASLTSCIAMQLSGLDLFSLFPFK